MEKKIKEIDGLIEAYLSGTLSDRGFVQLTELLNDNPEINAYFDQYKKNWLANLDDSERSWQRLRSKIILSDILRNKIARETQLPYQLLRLTGVLVVGLLLGAIISSGIFLSTNKSDKAIVFNAPKGEKSLIVLPDSTKVWLNGGTTLSTTRKFGVTNRKVELSGEAYFEVSKSKLLPLVVTSGPLQVKVLGTKFNLSAYEDQELIETTLKEGVIELSPTEEGTFRKFVIQKDEIAVFDRNTSKVHVGTTDVETMMAWKNNQLIIENEHYLNVFWKLENWYGVKFNFENLPKIEPNYSMTIKTESLREILELMSIISPIKYHIHGEDVALEFKKPK